MQAVPRLRLRNCRQYARNAIVAITFELFDRARSDLFGGAIHDAVDQFIRQFWRYEFGPGQLQRRAELLHEMTHARVAARQRALRALAAHGAQASETQAATLKYVEELGTSCRRLQGGKAGSREASPAHMHLIHLVRDLAASRV